MRMRNHSNSSDSKYDSRVKFRSQGLESKYIQRKYLLECFLDEQLAELRRVLHYLEVTGF